VYVGLVRVGAGAPWVWVQPVVRSSVHNGGRVVLVVVVVVGLVVVGPGPSAHAAAGTASRPIANAAARILFIIMWRVLFLWMDGTLQARGDWYGMSPESRPGAGGDRARRVTGLGPPCGHHGSREVVGTCPHAGYLGNVSRP
jgi:hypothetical protein